MGLSRYMCCRYLGRSHRPRLSKHVRSENRSHPPKLCLLPNQAACVASASTLLQSARLFLDVACRLSGVYNPDHFHDTRTVLLCRLPCCFVRISRARKVMSHAGCTASSIRLVVCGRLFRRFFTANWKDGLSKYIV